MSLKVVVICKSGRLDALKQAASSSAWSPEVFALSDINNPRIVAPGRFFHGKTDDLNFVSKCMETIKPDLVVIGPEEPLFAGVADLLAELGIPCVGPTKELAQLETSKSFARRLLKDYDIEGSPEHQVFDQLDGIEDYLRSRTDFVIKPDGLTGGKGVMVSGEHLHSVEEALAYCETLFESGQKSVIVEEKLDGEEFSLQSFFDGRHIAHMVPVQDHKRVFDGDQGPNTGGMGSYSCANHLLPFLEAADIRAAEEINRKVGEALLAKTGQAYKGILYGGFMLTKSGLKIIEYNARFGDPEIMNVLSIMETDFIDVCQAIVAGTLDKLEVKFKPRATVCKYLVPHGYPGKPTKNEDIDVSELDKFAASEKNLRVYFGAVAAGKHGLSLTGSRAIGVVGIGNSLTEAEKIAEKAAGLVRGPVHHRKDIGTPALIAKRVNHMAALKTASRTNFARVAGSNGY